MSGLADEVRRMSSMVASQAMIRQILAEMDPKFREPVVLRDVEGLEYSTIAEQLGIPLNTVRTRISRGRQYVADRVTEQMRSGGSLG
jgi:RNA polymerase sigma-70 factor (ECF subfamily)